MVVRRLEKQDLHGLLALLRRADQDASYRTMAPEGRETDELELELAETSPFSELVPFVLAEGDEVRAYACLCTYEGEAFLEGPLLAPGLEAEAAKPLVTEVANLARLHGYGFLEAFVDEENARSQRTLEEAAFEPFRTTYIYELGRGHRLPARSPSRFRFMSPGEIGVSAYRDLYRATSDNWATRLAWTDEELLDRFEDPEVVLILAYEGERLAGHLELEILPEDATAEIAYFGVLPEARGRGLGRQLLLKGLEEAFSNPGVEQVLARAHDDERRACRALEQIGFRLSHGVVAFTLELTE